MIRATLTLMLTVAGLASAAPAAACSVMRGYKVPTNLDLAIAGETIVLATVEGERKGKESWSGAVLAKPTLLIKGNALPDMVELEGVRLESNGQRAQHSDPRELRRPNPDTQIGGCVRYTFARGMQLVLFLKRGEDGKLTPYRSAFSRDAEDVVGPHALWVRAVREYAAISALPESGRKARLEARIAELRATQDDPDAAAIADDLQIELSGERLQPYD
jgi:hypothetical protein